MPKKPHAHDALLLRVCAEIGAGRISEGFIVDPGFQTDGLMVGASHHITINPAHQTVDTVIHECLHRLYPQWSETYVRNRTAFLRNRLTDTEVQTIFDEYQRRVKRLKRAKRVEA